MRVHQFVTTQGSGGQVTFVGTVRRFTDTGHTGYSAVENLGTSRPPSDRIETVALEYDAYRPFAIKAMRELIAEIRQTESLDRVVLLHRLGRVEVGQAAIVIAANSQHRKAAFRAVEFLIDHVKTRIPIWKRECLSDGSSYWVHPRPANST